MCDESSLHIFCLWTHSRIKERSLIYTGLPLVVRYTDLDLTRAGATLSVIRCKADVIDTSVPRSCPFSPHLCCVRPYPSCIWTSIASSSPFKRLILADAVNSDGYRVPIWVSHAQYIDRYKFVIGWPQFRTTGHRTTAIRGLVGLCAFLEKDRV
jgi:hypothetical protein